jgi:hypothetical protein
MSKSRTDSVPRCPLPSFGKEAIKIVRELEDLGWTFEVKSRGHAIGLAPDGETTCSIPARLSPANRSQQNAEAVLKRWKRQQQAIQETDKVEKVVSVLDPDDILHGPRQGDIQAQVLVAAARKHAGRAGAAMGEEMMLAAGVGGPEPRVTDVALPRVVSRRPWLARQGTSRKDATADLYESHAVIEVTWDDGSLSYECAKDGCDYTSANPRSVSSHFRAHVRAGETEPVGSLPRPSVAKDVPIDPASIGNGYGGKSKEYEPTERLVRALAHFLEAAGTSDVTALAFAALKWAHERPDLEDIEGRGSREPLTDGQILSRIRLLVGGRDPETEEALRNALATVDRLQVAYAEEVGKVAVLEQRLADSEATAQTWEDVAMRETQRADSLQSDIDAWLSLAPRHS